MAVRTGYAGTAADGDIYTAANHDRMPGGWIGHDNLGTSFSGITAASGKQTIATLTVTTATDRLLKISGFLPHLFETASTAGADAIVRIEDGGALELQRARFGEADWNTMVSILYFEVPASTSETYVLTFTAVVGTWALAAAGSPILFIEDVGPSS